MAALKDPFLLVCGPRGVGKSSVGFQVFYEVMRSGIKTAYVDLDQVSFCRPAPEADPDNHRIKARSLAAMWRVYQRAGARCLVAAGDVGGRAIVDAYAAAVPSLDLAVCRLSASAETLRERLLLRGRGQGPPIPGDELNGQPVDVLTRLAEESARSAGSPERRSVGDVHVATDGRSVAEVCALVRAELGDWPGPLPPS